MSKVWCKCGQLETEARQVVTGKSDTQPLSQCKTVVPHTPPLRDPKLPPLSRILPPHLSNFPHETPHSNTHKHPQAPAAAEGLSGRPVSHGGGQWRSGCGRHVLTRPPSPTCTPSPCRMRTAPSSCWSEGFGWMHRCAVHGGRGLAPTMAIKGNWSRPSLVVKCITSADLADVCQDITIQGSRSISGVANVECRCRPITMKVAMGAPPLPPQHWTLDVASWEGT